MKWEYMIASWNAPGNLGLQSCTTLGYEEWLNKMGADGWELVKVETYRSEPTSATTEPYFRGHSCSFKRRVTR